MKKSSFACVLCCMLFLLLPARGEEAYHTIHIEPEVDFETALAACRASLAERTGLPLDEIEQMHYTWSASPRFLILHSDEPYWKETDACWYFDIDYTDGVTRYVYDYTLSMVRTEEEPFSFLSHWNIERAENNPLRKALEQEYQENYGGMDEATAELEKERGPYFLWSYEDKAAFYDQWKLPPFFHEDYVNGYYAGHEQCVLPGPDDARYEAFSDLLPDLVKETFQLSDEVFDALYADVRFCHYGDDEPRWRIQYCMYADLGGVACWECVCVVSISRDGTEVNCVL